MTSQLWARTVLARLGHRAEYSWNVQVPQTSGLVRWTLVSSPAQTWKPCQRRSGFFWDGDGLTLEPWPAQAFPVVRDLVVDRSAFDRIIQAGGYVTAPTGSAPEAGATLVPKEAADTAFDAAACIGCGACVAACPNASAMLFVGAKVSQYALLPQGQPERERRVLAMRAAMDAEGFGHCTNEYECEAACPKEIKVSNIARLNREYFRATLVSE